MMMPGLLALNAATTVLLGLLVVTGVVLAMFGSNRTRLFAILGGVLWLLGAATSVVMYLVFVAGGTLQAGENTYYLLTVARNVINIIGIGLLAAAAILPPASSTQPYQPGAPGQPGYPGQQPGYPGQPGHPGQGAPPRPW